MTVDELMTLLGDFPSDANLIVLSDAINDLEKSDLRYDRDDNTVYITART